VDRHLSYSRLTTINIPKTSALRKRFF